MIIYDGKVERTPSGKEIQKILEKYPVASYKVENPAGYLTSELNLAIKKAKKPSKILVDGEEDLATIPAVLNAKEGSTVAYGQPSKGIVLVEVSKQKKKEFEKILELFEG